MIRAGIDEAGLGPVLGPYCAGMTSFFLSGDESLYDLLDDAVSQTAQKGKIAVGDSKKLYTPSRGPRVLEKSVLTFYSILYGIPSHFGEFLKNLTGDDLSGSPWFAHPEELALPMACTREDIDRDREILLKAMEARGIVLKKLHLRFITASAFNRGIDRTGNKGALCQDLLDPLMAAALKEDDVILTVDRQGGRRFYGDWLLSLLPGKPLQAVEERAERSLYRSGTRIIQFMVGAEGKAMETALASLFAKFARECAMMLFNRHWTGKCEGIGETAGYYKDGTRFIKDLEKARLLPDDRDILIRKK